MEITMYRYSTKYQDEIFREELETESGDMHPFFGFILNREDTESVEGDIHKGVIPKEGTKYDPVKISSGNLLYIPDLPEEDDVFYVDSKFGEWGFEIQVRPKSNILTGTDYFINLREILDDKGVYKSLAHKEKIMDVPNIVPISDYYIARELGKSEEFLPELI